MSCVCRHLNRRLIEGAYCDRCKINTRYVVWVYNIIMFFIEFYLRGNIILLGIILGGFDRLSDYEVVVYHKSGFKIIVISPARRSLIYVLANLT